MNKTLLTTNKHSPFTHFPNGVAKNVNKPVYAIIQHQVVNPLDSNQVIYILYLLNLNNAIISDLILGKQPFKSDQILQLIFNINKNGYFEYQNTLFLTLKITPFSTKNVQKAIQQIGATHAYYKKFDIMPIVDFSKDYLNAVTRVTILNNNKVDLNDLKDIQSNWNKLHQPLFKEMGHKYNYDPNILFFKK